MRTAAVGSYVGVVASLTVLVALAAPYALISEPGTGLGLYYGAGPTGAGAVAFLAALSVVVLLAGTRGSADPGTAAGIALVLGLAALAVTVAWATAVDQGVVFSFPAAWMGWHRWAVVALVAVVPLGAATYAWGVLR